ncbi:MAG: Lrp/AsnC family transcriptional regulator [Candidatus Dormibacter sp.]
MADSVAPLAGLTDVVAGPARTAVLDAVDLEILQLLAGDARLSQRSLARSLGMSPPAVGERISRLERAGVIRAYSIEVGWPEAGFPVTVYLTITAVQGHSLAPVIEALRALPEVTDVSLVTGAIDLMARLVVRDHNHLRELLLQRVWQITGVQRTETLVTLAEMKPKRFAVQLLHSMRAQLAGAAAAQGGVV